MLTAKVCVEYQGDWTEELQQYNVFGEFLASTFQNRHYIGVMTLETDDFDQTLKIIEGHKDIESVEVMERFSPDGSARSTGTLFLRGNLSQFSPLQALMYEGFLPIGSTKLEDGCECFDLLLENQEDLSDVTDILREFGTVHLDCVSQDFQREITPSTTEWHELLSSIPDRQRELLTLASERGYFEIPRQVTLEELADEMGITKTTASNHLRKAEKQIMEFLIEYVNLASEK